MSNYHFINNSTLLKDHFCFICQCDFEETDTAVDHDDDKHPVHQKCLYIFLQYKKSLEFHCPYCQLTFNASPILTPFEQGMIEYVAKIEKSAIGSDEPIDRILRNTNDFIEDRLLDIGAIGGGIVGGKMVGSAGAVFGAIVGAYCAKTLYNLARKSISMGTLYSVMALSSSTGISYKRIERVHYMALSLLALGMLANGIRGFYLLTHRLLQPEPLQHTAQIIGAMVGGLIANQVDNRESITAALKRMSRLTGDNIFSRSLVGILFGYSIGGLTHS